MYVRRLFPLISTIRASQTKIRNVSKSTHPSAKKTGIRLGMASLTVGALIGTGYSIHQLNKPKLDLLNAETCISVINSVPDIKPSRVVQYDRDKSGLKLRLYQYQTCPFCCKVRAFLDYHAISYEIVEVDPVLRQATKWSTYKKVPILLAKVEDGYQPMNDSTMIISALASFLGDDKSLQSIVKCYPLLHFQDESGTIKTEIMNRYFLMFNENLTSQHSKEEVQEERKWRKWADDVLVHDLSPNVYRSTGEALQAFNWFSEVGEWEKHFPAWERNLIVYVGAVAMLFIGKRLKKRHNLKDDVRQSLYDHCNIWVRAVDAKGTTFLGGKQPNLADLAVYGVLSSIEGCDAFSDVLKHSTIGPWYNSMKDSIAIHKELSA